jgi:hypothetical protein
MTLTLLIACGGRTNAGFRRECTQSKPKKNGRSDYSVATRCHQAFN